MGWRPPIWGCMVAHADEDVISCALLYESGLLTASLYHACQAIEKYLKALVLAQADPLGKHATPDNVPGLRIHSLVRLAKKCEEAFPYCAGQKVIDDLARFEEFDQCTRYPWVERSLGNGFSGSDLPLIEGIIRNVRMELPIVKDDYHLGMVIRGRHHKGPPVNDVQRAMSRSQKMALESVFNAPNEFVHW